MRLQRLYVPITGADVIALLAVGTLPAGRTAYGVSPSFAAATPRADEDEREYLTFLDAVAAAAGLTPDSCPLAVLAIDLPESEITWPSAGTALTLPRPVLRREAVSFHVGEEPGPDADLLWYDITEATQVADLLAQD